MHDLEIFWDAYEEIFWDEFWDELNNDPSLTFGVGLRKTIQAHPGLFKKMRQKKPSTYQLVTSTETKGNT